MAENKVNFQNFITNLPSILETTVQNIRYLLSLGADPDHCGGLQLKHGNVLIMVGRVRPFLEFQYTTHGLLSPTEFCIFCDGCPDALGAGAAREGGILLVIQKSPVLQIRIRKIYMFLDLLDPDPDPLVRGADNRA
jgi:hypothetical protein